MIIVLIGAARGTKLFIIYLLSTVTKWRRRGVYSVLEIRYNEYAHSLHAWYRSPGGYLLDPKPGELQTRFLRKRY